MVVARFRRALRARRLHNIDALARGGGKPNG